MPIALNSADQFLGFAISILGMQFSKRGFMTDPSFIPVLRIAFGLSVICQIAAALYIRMIVAAKNDRTVFKYKAEPSLFNTGALEETEMTNVEYDTAEINKTLRTCCIQSLIIAFVHYRWNITQPILIQSATFLRNMMFNPLYRAHIYGMKILRPYDRNMLFETASSSSAAEPVVEDVTESEKKKKKED